MPQLVLASSSPYRRELLARLMIPFEVMSPDIDETHRENETPQQLVTRLSIEKAQAVIPHYPKALIIGSDQVAVHDHDIVGKPRDHGHAVQQLQQASGKHITLYTGLALVNAENGSIQSEVIPFTVVFRKLTDEQIETYLKKEQPYKCAGSVKSEGLGIALLERFEGEDPNTLIGLPLIRLVKMLGAEGLAVI